MRNDLFYTSKHNNKPKCITIDKKNQKKTEFAKSLVERFLHTNVYKNVRIFSSPLR